MRRTKIVATLGPATSSEEMIGKLVQAGVNVTRLNFSHGAHEDHINNARTVRAAAKEHGRNVAILQDIQGPKIRTGEVAEGTELEEGSEVTLAPGDFEGDANRLSTSYEDLAQDVDEGDRLLIDDGLLGLQVERIEGNEVVCKVIEGGEVSSHKGLNFPDTSLSVKGLTPKDLEDLEFGIQELKPDWIAASFVRSGDEVREIKERIKEFGGENIPLISKIEKHEAIEDIEDIMNASDGIMVARGDLAVELSNERVPIEQKRLVARCRRLGKPVIVATQMLDSMIRNPPPDPRRGLRRGERHLRPDRRGNALRRDGGRCLCLAERAGDGPHLPGRRGCHQLRSRHQRLRLLGPGRPLRRPDPRSLRAGRGPGISGHPHLDPERAVVHPAGTLPAAEQDPRGEPHQRDRGDAGVGVGGDRDTR